MSPVEIRELEPNLVAPAAGLLGRGMRDNPLHVQAFGAHPAIRETALARFFLPVLEQYLAKGTVLGGFHDGELVGVCGMVKPGRCQPTFREKLRVFPAVVRGNPLSTTGAVLRWTRAWARHDPPQPHWHLGPVAVDRGLQGRGIGSALLEEFCRAMDRSHSVAYLETDKRENVKFYERFGFAVTAEAPVLGAPNWFMLRPTS